MKTSQILRWWSMLGVAAMGCDAQAPAGYTGESLLTLRGSIELTQQRPEGPLVPALLFPREGQGLSFDVLDVDVQGTFPADFQLEVRKPPPFIPTPDPHIGGPAAVLGYITAAAAGHPEMVRYANWHTGHSITGCVPTNCGDGGPCMTTEACVTEDTWCADDDCYNERKSCPKINSPAEQCTILSSEGDAKLKAEPLHEFAGFSTNYQVLYLADRAPADAYVTRAVGMKRAIEPGYHLVSKRRATDEERERMDACEREAEDLAVERTNQRRGTDYSHDDVFDYYCRTGDECPGGGFDCVPPPPPDGRLCVLSSAEREKLEDEVEKATNTAKLELDCPLSSRILQLVEDPSSERITVELSIDEGPGGAFSKLL